MRIGLFVGGGLLTATGIWLLGWWDPGDAWFPIVMAALGLVAVVASFRGELGRFKAEYVDGPGEPAPAKDAAAELQARLADLDRLRAAGTLTAAEHRRKRQDLIGAWGLPERPG